MKTTDLLWPTALMGLTLAAVGSSLPSCTADTSFLGCRGLSGEELAQCEAYNAGAMGAGGLQGAGGVGGVTGAGGSATGSAGESGGGSGGGGGLVCTAPDVNCDGTCVDVTADDAKNCGTCGRSCLGTALCKSGACVPEVMASSEVAPYALADDGTNLYWVSPAIKGDVAFSRMRRVAKASAGGAAQNTFSTTIVRARSLAFSAGKLYWGDLAASPSDTDNQKLVAGTPGASFPIDPPFAADQVGVEHLTVGGSKVYWVAIGGSVVRGKAADGTGAIAPEVPLQTNPRWVAVDGEARPYWVANAGGGQREVRRLVASPPNAHQAVTSGTDIIAVELASDRFYWADGKAGTVRSAAKTDAVPATGRDEFSGHGKVEGFRIEVAGGAGGASGAGGTSGSGGAGGSGGASGVMLYVLTTAGQKLQAWRKGPDDEAPLLLGEVEAKAEAYAGNPFGAAYVLTDGQYVYFADVGTVDVGQVVPVSQGDGVVYRVAK